jgi:hypothetical protein
MRITLCGSARFEKQFKELNERLTLQGHTVYSLAVYPSDKAGQKMWYTDAEKTALDAAHKKKIDNSDAIVVINVDGYIGESTRSEIWHAVANKKRVLFVFGYAMSADDRKIGHQMCHYKGCMNDIMLQPCALCYE